LALLPPLRRWPILLATGFTLVMSAQIFAYVIDVPGLYAMAKIWPIVAAPFALVVLLRHKVDHALLFLLLLLYGLLVPPVISLFTLGNNAVGAVSTTVKLVAFANYFSTAGLLLLFRPTLSETRGVIFGLGLLTFGILWLLWIIEPLSAYSFSLDNSYIFFNDLERGPRIYAPMYFGFLLMFAINRSFWRRPGWWQLPVLVFAFFTLFHIYKEKFSILGVFLCLGYGAVVSFRRTRLLQVGLVLGLAGIAVLGLPMLDLDRLSKAAGGSLETRVLTTGYALDFLGSDPWRWLFGVGALTRVGPVSFASLFRFRLFYLSDIGWLGILFEYGIIGSVLIGSIYIAALRLVDRAGDDLLLLSLFDLVLYLVIVDSVYSAVVSPGEVTTCMAVAFYAKQLPHTERALT
jgi:hypothetical protein